MDKKNVIEPKNEIPRKKKKGRKKVSGGKKTRCCAYPALVPGQLVQLMPRKGGCLIILKVLGAPPFPFPPGGKKKRKKLLWPLFSRNFNIPLLKCFAHLGNLSGFI